MLVKEIPISEVDVSELNTRKNLADGQLDSTVEDLARSIQKQGLLSPITVFQKPDGRYAVIAGQRRLLACKHVGMPSIPAIVRENMDAADATAVSLVENVHRADMNPHDKAAAFKALLDKMGDYSAVCRETGVGVQTIRKYVQLLDLAPALQDRLAAGDVKNTEALARLAQKISDPVKQLQVWDKIGGFTQEVQKEIIGNLNPSLDNLDDLVDRGLQGAFSVQLVRNCPMDCQTIPGPLKNQIQGMIESYNREQIENVEKEDEEFWKGRDERLRARLDDRRKAREARKQEH
jgi:ParB/RepB/Spo0J family partition protein